VDEVVASALDYGRFGVSIARIAIDRAEDVPVLVERCRDLGIEMVVARTEVLDLGAAHALEAVGGMLCDTLVYYARSLDGPMPRGDRVRLAGPADADQVASIAAAAFTNYRGHYQADPRLDPAAADDVYRDWARRACTVTGVADRVWVVEVESRGVGFLALRFNDGTEAEIVLNAVRPENQRQGLYSELLRTALAESYLKGAARCLVSTQVGNAAVQRVWSRLGFEPVSARHTFHVWLDRVPDTGRPAAPSAR